MASANVINVGDNNFKTEVLDAKGLVLVDFWAAWCGPCKMVAPVIDELADDFQGRVKVCKLNVDENSKTASDYGVMSIPTLIIFKEGKEVERLVGFKPKAALAQALESRL